MVPNIVAKWGCEDTESKEEVEESTKPNLE